MSSISQFKTNFEKTKQNVLTSFEAGIVPFVKSSPGMGKSAMFKEIAKEKQLEFIDFRAGEMDPTEIKGFPYISGERANYAPTEIIPIEGDSLPKGKKGFLLLCDELTSAPPAVQAAMYRLILDRKVGDKNVHERVFIAAAGNMEDDGAVVEEMSTALKSRMATFYLATDRKQWLSWAMDNDINDYVLAYLNYRTDYLNRFKPESAMMETNYACERTWEFVSKALNSSANKHLIDTPAENRSFFAGILGEAVGSEFAGFIEIASQVVSIEDIIKDPVNTLIPQKPEQRWALAATIGDSINEDNVNDLLTYLFQMPIEFQILALSKLKKQNPVILQENTRINDWVLTNAERLY